MMPPIVDVRLTDHAQVRARMRIDDPTPHRVVGREVAAGLAAGRRALRQPAWAVDDEHNRAASSRRGEKRNGRSGTLRWTWNDAQTRAYLVDLSTRGVARVITVLAPPSDPKEGT